jgi:hypothetical protein
MRTVEKFLRRCFGNERRCSARFAISQPVWIRFGESENEIDAVAIEISETGMLFRTPYCIPRKTDVTLATCMPVDDGDSAQEVLLQGAGRVVAVRKLMTGEYDTAIEFRRLKYKRTEARTETPAMQPRPVPEPEFAYASAMVPQMLPSAPALTDPEAAALLKKWFVKAS